ncbi:MAG: TRAP transporter small permease subunit [Desulfobacteraceae bacterium]|nr:TRAP transporter small permease subunit [Desulfobacteraceae bacterium]
MGKIIGILEGISEWTGRIFCFLVIIINALVVIEVIMRRFLNHPTVCNFEITLQVYALHFMIVAAFTLLHNSHVSIDLIHSKLPERVKALVDVISYLVFFFPFTIIVLVKGTEFAACSWAIMEKSWSICSSPVYPIKTVIPVTAFLLMLQGIAIFIRKVHVLITGVEIYHGYQP